MLFQLLPFISYWTLNIKTIPTLCRAKSTYIMHIQVHNMFGKPKTKKCTVLGPALYTVALKATFDHINFTVSVVWAGRGSKRKRLQMC